MFTGGEKAHWPGPRRGGGVLPDKQLSHVSNVEKQERAAWLSEADVEFFTGSGPTGPPSSSEEQPADPDMQRIVQVHRCCTAMSPLIHSIGRLGRDRANCRGRLCGPDPVNLLPWLAETIGHWHHCSARPWGLWPHPDGAAAAEARQTDVFLCRATVADQGQAVFDRGPDWVCCCSCCCSDPLLIWDVQDLLLDCKPIIQDANW